MWTRCKNLSSSTNNVCLENCSLDIVFFDPTRKPRLLANFRYELR